jgi:TetR/AcrR family transcriptional regulator, transcriptional repressor for nem operon
MDTQTKDTRSHILSVGRSLTARQGYSGVGLNELLKAADVPKGSFYHYFASKEAYGCALLEDFVAQYRVSLGETLFNPKMDARARLMSYFESWLRKQTGPNLQDRCLVVKLSAEVADLSTDMSKILQHGVAEIIASLTKTIEEGIAEGSVASIQDPNGVAQSVYYQWLGASLIAALTQDSTPLKTALKSTASAIPPA